MMTRQLVSRPTLEKVARMTDLDVKAKTPEQTEAMLNGLASRISIADAGRENLYTISYQDANGELAKKVVQSLLTIFVETSLGKTRLRTFPARSASSRNSCSNTSKNSPTRKAP
jgi:uncharacterized protein involved in exopolysaccharide biosynthesis